MAGKQGGKRPGAGRPASLQKQIEKAEKLAERLKSSTERGLDLLAEAYPKLMQQAIDMALDGDKSMLKELIRLLPSMTDMGGSSGSERSPIAVLIQNNMAKQTPSDTIEGHIKVIDAG